MPYLTVDQTHHHIWKRCPVSWSSSEEKQVEIKSAFSKTVNFNTKIVSFEIVTDNGNSNININAYTACHLDVTTVKYDANEIKNQYQHLKDIPFCDINGDNVGC